MVQAARLNIKTHFSVNNIDMQPFVGMELNVLPSAIPWMGRNGIGEEGTWGEGFELLYQISCAMLWAAALCRSRRRRWLEEEYLLYCLVQSVSYGWAHRPSAISWMCTDETGANGRLGKGFELLYQYSRAMLPEYSANTMDASGNYRLLHLFK